MTSAETTANFDVLFQFEILRSSALAHAFVDDLPGEFERASAPLTERIQRLRPVQSCSLRNRQHRGI